MRGTRRGITDAELELLGPAIRRALIAVGKPQHSKDLGWRLMDHGATKRLTFSEAAVACEYACQNGLIVNDGSPAGGLWSPAPDQ